MDKWTTWIGWEVSHAFGLLLARNDLRVFTWQGLLCRLLFENLPICKQNAFSAVLPDVSKCQTPRDCHTFKEGIWLSRYGGASEREHSGIEKRSQAAWI